MTRRDDTYSPVSIALKPWRTAETTRPVVAVALVLWAKLVDFAKHYFATPGNWQNEGGRRQNLANVTWYLPYMVVTRPKLLFLNTIIYKITEVYT